MVLCGVGPGDIDSPVVLLRGCTLIQPVYLEGFWVLLVLFTEHCFHNIRSLNQQLVLIMYVEISSWKWNFISITNHFHYFSSEYYIKHEYTHRGRYVSVYKMHGIGRGRPSITSVSNKSVCVASVIAPAATAVRASIIYVKHHATNCIMDTHSCRRQLRTN